MLCYATKECVYVCMLFILYGTTQILTESVNVSTPVGIIVGVRNGFTFGGTTYQVRKYLGIPYAESTAGEKRFTKPVKKATFSDDYYANVTGMSCVQNTKLLPGLDLIPADEDCLNLNIIAPDSASVNEKKTVMVFIHGGGFQFGTQNSYIAEALSALHDVVYVTLNYRVNVYGFLASKRHGLNGNYGLWDQHLAIRWIHDNIASFGGDPDQVTLFGESAGAASVMYQALYDGNKGLFNRIILQSGVVGGYWSYTRDPDFSFRNMNREVGCERDTTSDVLSCLRKTDIRFDEAFSATLAVKETYLPVQDGDFIKFNPAELYNLTNPSSLESLRTFADVDAIIGFNSMEGFLDIVALGMRGNIDIPGLSRGLTLPDLYTYLKEFSNAANKSSKYSIRESIIHKYTDWNRPDDDIARRTSLLDMMSDSGMQVPVLQTCIAHALISTNRNTYMYIFDHRPSFSTTPEWVTGADHAEELSFVFGFPSILMYLAGLLSEDPTLIIPNNEIELSKSMMTFWTQFAKFGTPNGENTSDAWPVYDKEKKQYILFKTNETPFPVGDHFRTEYVDYWTRVYPQLVADIEEAGREKTDCAHVVGRATSNESQTLYMFMYSLIVVALNFKWY